MKYGVKVVIQPNEMQGSIISLIVSVFVKVNELKEIMNILNLSLNLYYVFGLDVYNYCVGNRSSNHFQMEIVI